MSGVRTSVWLAIRDHRALRNPSTPSGAPHPRRADRQLAWLPGRSSCRYTNPTTLAVLAPAIAIGYQMPSTSPRLCVCELSADLRACLHDGLHVLQARAEVGVKGEPRRSAPWWPGS